MKIILFALCGLSCDRLFLIVRPAIEKTRSLRLLVARIHKTVCTNIDSNGIAGDFSLRTLKSSWLEDKLRSKLHSASKLEFFKFVECRWTSFQLLLAHGHPLELSPLLCCTSPISSLNILIKNSVFVKLVLHNNLTHNPVSWISDLAKMHILIHLILETYSPIYF